MTQQAIGFVDFVEGVLNVELTPGQRVIGRVAYDGVDPVELEGDERELAREIFGLVDRVPAQARAVFVAVCGRGAGKSYILAALRALHLALTVTFARLAPGEVAVSIVVAPDLRLARQTLGFVAGAIAECSPIADLVRSKTADRIELERPDGVRVAIECLPATVKGSALRGRTTACAVLDEAAFFRDAETGQVNDLEVYRALQPRVVAGGQTIIASTPWTEVGLMFDLFEANHGSPETALAAHAPTLLLQDTAETREMVAREEKRDPTNARREFGALFMPADAATFFDPRAIAAAVDETLVVPVPWNSRRASEYVVAVGADFAFRRDSSALVVVTRDTEDMYCVAAVEERIPQGQPLKPSVTIAGFAQVALGYGADLLVADNHYRESVHEHLQAAHVALVPAPEGATGKADTYVVARNLLLEGRVRIPNHERLRKQLKEVTSRPLAGGGLAIESPRSKTGGHGDLVSALVLALWWASLQGRPMLPHPGPKPGTPEWCEQKEDQRMDRVFAANRERERDEENWLYGDWS